MKVLIAGGGFAGMGVAAALSRFGHDVTVYESAKTTDSRFRGELIHPRGVRALDELGLSSALRARSAVAVTGFAVTPKGGEHPTLLRYGTEQGLGLGMGHHDLVLTLRELVTSRRNVELHTSARVDQLLIEGNRVTGIRTHHGEKRRADLVVIADGRSSKLRAQLGLEPELKLLSHTIAFSVDGELPCGPMGHVFLGGPGPVLAYPYAPGKLRFCVDVPLGAAKGKAAIIELLERAYAPAIAPSLRAAMSQSLHSVPFEGCANHSIATTSCAAPGVVLVGDAGGCSHPLTASGMTCALNDALTLSTLLQEFGNTDRALTAYQRRRYDFVRMRELFTDSLYEVFRGNDEGSHALQTGVFRYWHSSERARRVSMNILSGEEIRLSRFVQEYSRVFRRSALEVLKHVPSSPANSTRRLRSLAKTTAGRFGEAFERSARTVVDRYRRGLHSLGSV